MTYFYDAWGNHLSTTGTMSATLGTLNPLRYRGYVYDQETGLYYLQSRYYNPKNGRFINADALASTGQGELGNNMFAYCLNNPVNHVDMSGCYSVKSERKLDTINITIEYECKIGKLVCTVVIDIEINYIGDAVIDLGAMILTIGTNGFTIETPSGDKATFLYNNIGGNDLTSIEAPFLENGHIRLSEDGIGAGLHGQIGNATIDITVYPDPLSVIDLLLSGLPGAPAGGGYSGCGGFGFGGFNMPLHNPTMMFM